MNAIEEFERGTDAIESAVRLLVRRPSDVLPFYFIAAGAATVAQVPLLIAGAIAYLDLAARNRIEALLTELEAFEGEVGADPETGEPDLPPGLEEAILGLFTPTVVAAILFGVLGAVFAFVLARAIAGAGIVNAIYAVLCDEPPLTEGVRGFGRDWLAFLGVWVLRIFVLGIAGVVGFVGLGLVATGQPAAIAIGALLVLGTPVLAVLLYLPLAFAGQAIVVERTGAIRGVEHSTRFLFGRPTAVLLYVAVVLALGATVAVVTGILGVAGVSRLSALFTAFVALPFLDVFKTALYARRTVPDRPVPGLRERLRAGTRRSLGALARFLRTQPLATIAGLGTFAVGFWAGWAAIAPYGIQIEPAEDVAEIFGPFPVATFVDIAANNWLVAIAGSHAGLALGIPTIAVLLFNGALGGALAGVYEPIPFLALVAPHGIIEVPAIAVAGGVGFYLGYVAWKGIRGHWPAERVAETLAEAYWVLLGLLLPFVVAAFIEAFLTPRIGALVIGG